MSKKNLFSIFIIFAFLFLFMMNNQIKTTNSVVQKTNPYKNLGYTSEDMQILINQLEPDQLNYIINNKIHKDVLMPYLHYKSFVFKHIFQYEEKRTTQNISYLEAINSINHPHINNSFYEALRPSVNLNTNLVLVNKNYYLDDDYVPNDLVYASDLNLLIPDDISRNLIKREVYFALKALLKAAEKRGVFLYFSSGYRSYQKQASVYHRYTLESRNADTFSARPGHSEHQTGLAVDLTSMAVDFQLVESFDETAEGRFLKEHAHKYGFIIRYQKEKEHLTGYQYEPWHLRYVGIDAATTIKNENLTLETYLLKYTQIDYK